MSGGPSRYRREAVACVSEGMCAVCCAWIARGTPVVMVTPLEWVVSDDLNNCSERAAGLSMGCCSDDCADTFEVEEALNAGSATL